MLFRFLFLLIFASQLLFGVQVPASHVLPTHPNIKAPWFTGPLLAPSALTIPPGHFNIEPYVYLIANIGHYDHHWKKVESEIFWNCSFQPYFQVGINRWMDCIISPVLYYNYTKGAGNWEIGDLPIGVDFQLFTRTKSLTDWNTSLRLSFRAQIPIGKYQKLNPSKKLTDVGGDGTWSPAIGINWGNLFYIGKDRFITWRNAFSYSIPTRVHVKNLNAYGGGAGTRGTVSLPMEFAFDTAIEITLTRNWVFACDFVGNWTGKTRFKGRTTVSNSSPSSVQFSMAPAFEYNWSANIGMIFGSWFSIIGRNATQFVSAVIAFNYFH